jgi:hypothetical protein
LVKAMTRLRPFVVELGKYSCVSSGCQVLDSDDVVVFLLLFSVGLGRQGFTSSMYMFVAALRPLIFSSRRTEVIKMLVEEARILANEWIKLERTRS